MFKIDDLFEICDGFAPIRLSKQMIANGEYDNSGIIVRSHEEVKGILFSLDLSDECVKKAVELNCDTIVTHHPAIYTPLKNLDCKSALSSLVLKATENKMNVISMHLNLDVAKNGIDKNLAEGLKAENTKVLEMLDGEHGYGREFSVNIGFYDYVEYIKKEFGTDKVIAYGRGDEVVEKVASFCGGGSGYAENTLFSGRLSADTVVTSDMPHHVIKYMIESGKKIILLPHYVAENYGFLRYYEDCSEVIGKRAETFYFDDKRFK